MQLLCDKHWAKLWGVRQSVRQVKPTAEQERSNVAIHKQMCGRKDRCARRENKIGHQGRGKENEGEVRTG